MDNFDDIINLNTEKKIKKNKTQMILNHQNISFGEMSKLKKNQIKTKKDINQKLKNWKMAKYKI